MAILAYSFGSPSEVGPFDDKCLVMRHDTEEEDIVSFRNKIGRFLNQGKNVVWADASPSRKARMKMYNHVKKQSPTCIVGSLQTFRTLEELQELEPHKTHEEVLKYYKALQPSRKKVDCDTLSFSGTRFFKDTATRQIIETLEDFIDEQCEDIILPELKLLFQEHGNKHHQETIDSHINQAIQNSNTFFMRLISLFHDMAKGITKDEDGRFIQHQNVGANYLMNALWCGSDLPLEQPGNGLSDVAEVVLHHMSLNRETGKLPSSVVERNKLNREVVQLIEFFVNKIDMNSRKV